MCAGFVWSGSELADASGKVAFAKVNAEAGQQVDFDAIKQAVAAC
ncbi:MAG: hypothetical protein ACKOHI_08075 [Phycisphaerales bacterium]